MAIYWAKATGNWSTRTNWLTAVGQDAGSLPMSADDVYSNGFNITIDGNYQVNSIRNIRLLTPVINPGGSFIISTGGISFSAFVYGGGVADVPCLNFTGGLGTFSSLIGSLCAGDPLFQVSRPLAFLHNSNGRFLIRGNAIGNISDGTTSFGTGYIRNTLSGALDLQGIFWGADLPRGLWCIRNEFVGTVSVTGAVIGGRAGGSYGLGLRGRAYIEGLVQGGPAGFSDGIYIENTNTRDTFVTVRGDVMGGGSDASVGVYMAGSGAVSITGRLMGGIGTFNSPGIRNISGWPIFVLGSVQSLGSPGISSENSSNVITIIGEVSGIGRPEVPAATAAIVLGANSTTNARLTVSGNVYGAYGPGISNSARDATIVIDGFAKGGWWGDGVVNTGLSAKIYLRTAVGSGWGIYSVGNVAERAVRSTVALSNSQVTAIVGIQNITCGSRGSFPTTGVVFLTSFDNFTGEFYTFRKVDYTTTTFLRAQTFPNYVPRERDVRLGTPYSGLFPFNEKTGTLAMPQSSQVIFGVPIDDSTGVGFLCATDAWKVPVSTLSAIKSMGALARNSATINSISAVVTFLNY